MSTLNRYGYLSLLCISISLLASGCFTKKGGPLTDDEIILWEKFGVTAANKILDLHATPTELFYVTDNQFARFSLSGDLVEKRVLSDNLPLLGSHTLSDNTFMRVRRNALNKQELEFHVCKNPAQIFTVSSDELLKPTDEVVHINTSARHPGCYSADGTKYFLPVIFYPNYHYSFLIFDIKMNPSTTQIVDINLIKRVDVPGLPADFETIRSSRFLGGAFYCATQNGAYQVKLDGSIKKITDAWMFDFFADGNKLYCTGFDAYDFRISTDNGATWSLAPVQSEINYVETCGNKIFEQDNFGRAYALVSADLKSSTAVRRNAEFSQDPSANMDITFFNGRYFISIDKEIFSNTTIFTK